MTMNNRTHVPLLAGPVLFSLFLLLPLGAAPFEVRAGLGLLLWMAVWWVSGAVHLAVTAFLPVVVVAALGIAPMDKVLPAYAGELVILLIGASMLATVWSRWGLDKRIALATLLSFGSGARTQIMAWLVVSMLLSAVLPNTVVAAALMPIAVAMLGYIGIKDLASSTFGTAVMLAVAWGSSAGGMATPLGGAPNLLTVQFVEDAVLHREFAFGTWVVRILPFVLVTAVIVALFFRFVFKPEFEEVEGGREFFRGRLRALGRSEPQEWWGLALFLIAVTLAFTRPIYARTLPSLHPAFVFLGLGLGAFVIRVRGVPLLTWEHAEKHMPWGLFYLFAGGAALGRVLVETGAAGFVAEAVGSIAGSGGAGAVAGLSLVTIVLTQITSNTAAVAILVPITLSVFASGDAALPFVYIVAAVGNLGMLLPSSSGGPAIAAGYGANLPVMFWKGIRLIALLWIALALLGYLLLKLWPAFSTG